MRGSLIILGFFVCGILLGYYDFLPMFFVENDFTLYLLYVLIFLVGLSLGADRDSFEMLRKSQFKIVLVPLSVIVGTAVGVLPLVFMYDSLSVSDVLGVGAGYGYYSLSSVLITEIRGEELGVIALLYNIMRELMALLLIPIFVRFGKLGPIVAAGATSMDSTLPVITRFVGREFAVISLFSGMVLTILVPFIVTFFLSF